MERLDRKEHVSEILDELQLLANNDMRISQVFENIRSKNNNDLFNMENDEFLKLLREFTSPLKKSEHD